MINLYDSKETDFSKNGIVVLNDVMSAPITEEINGIYEIELEYPIDERGKWKYLVEHNIIKADKQLFRIYHKITTLTSIKVNARHIFYDLLDNFIESLTITNLTGYATLESILLNTQYTHPFTSSGDVGNTFTKVFSLVNPVDAILGDDGIIANWGGELIRDNFSISLMGKRGLDRGVLVSYGKNIQGIEETLDTDNLITRIYPTFAGANDTVVSLPEKYIDSPYILNYPHPKVKTISFSAEQIASHDVTSTSVSAAYLDMITARDTLSKGVADGIIAMAMLTQISANDKILNIANLNKLIGQRNVFSDEFPGINNKGVELFNIFNARTDTKSYGIVHKLSQLTNYYSTIYHKLNIMVDVYSAQWSSTNTTIGASNMLGMFNNYIGSRNALLGDIVTLKTQLLNESQNSPTNIAVLGINEATTNVNLAKTKEISSVATAKTAMAMLNTVSSGDVIKTMADVNKIITQRNVAQYEKPYVNNDGTAMYNVFSVFTDDDSKALALSLATDNTAYSEAWHAIDAWVEAYSVTWSSTHTAIDASTMKDKFNAYFDAKDKILSDVIDARKQLLVNAQTAANLANDIVTLRALGEGYFALSQCDVPVFNYVIDFTELSKTVEYKNYAVLERVYLGDTITIRHTKLEIDLKAEVIKTIKDPITDRITGLEVGSFRKNITSSMNDSIQEVKQTIKQVSSDYQDAIDNATKIITGAKGGNVVIRKNDAGEPSEILIMDTTDIMTAINVWRWNIGGFGYSKAGVNGPFETAITMDGHIVAAFIYALEIDGEQIKTGIIKSTNGKSQFDLDKEIFNLGTQIVYKDSKLTFGSDVVLQWGNLSEETQTNLQGVKGDGSYFHIKYSDSTDGSNMNETGGIYMGTYSDALPDDSLDKTKYVWIKAAGTDGTPINAYLHIKYSANANGNPLSETGNTYMGTYSDQNEEDSTDYTKYTWIKAEGTDGQGLPGTSSYLHIKYSNDGVNFTSNTGETVGTWLGTRVDSTPEDSSTPSAYIWAKIKGDDGQSIAGTSSYMHIKYSDTGYSFTGNGGETVGAYLGTRTDSTQADSTSFYDYTWVKIKGEDGSPGIGAYAGITQTTTTNLEIDSPTIKGNNIIIGDNLILNPSVGSSGSARLIISSGSDSIAAISLNGPQGNCLISSTPSSSLKIQFPASLLIGSTGSGDINLGSPVNCSSISAGVKITTPLVSGNGSVLQLTCDGNPNLGLVVDSGNNVRSAGASNTAPMNLGTSGHCWASVWQTNGVMSKSDRNLKNSISSLDNIKTLAFILALNPVSYRMNNGTSGRFHKGLIAQEVEAVMIAQGMKSTDFAGWVKAEKTRDIVTKDDKGNDIVTETIIPNEYEQALRYEELISPIINVVQQQQKRINSQDELIADLLTRVTALEAK